MARFITIGYGDSPGYQQTDPAVRQRAHDHDALLKERGAIMGVAGRPVQVRNHDSAGLETLEIAYMQSALPVAGFAVIEAESLEEAIELVSKAPCAVAQGVVEVWPLEE